MTAVMLALLSGSEGVVISTAAGVLERNTHAFEIVEIPERMYEQVRGPIPAYHMSFVSFPVKVRS